MGIAELLTVAFIALKLLGVIDWSWWLVCLPEIIAAAVYLVILAVGIIGPARTIHKINRDMDRRDW